MKSHFIHTILLMAALLALVPTSVQAVMPDGIYELEFPEIYDLSNFTDCETVNVDGFLVTQCITLTMTPDGSGNHKGTAELEFTGDFEGTLVGPASARIKGGAAGGKVKLQFSTSGTLDIFQIGNMFIRVDSRCKGTHSRTGYMTAVCKTTAKVPGVSSATEKGMFVGQLDGSVWIVTIDVTPIDGKKFKGTGADSLGNSYSASGKYSGKTGKSAMKLQGKPGPSNGAKIKLQNFDPISGTAAAKYKVQGIKGTGKVAAP
jgi:hypothetical protein